MGYRQAEIGSGRYVVDYYGPDLNFCKQVLRLLPCCRALCREQRLKATFTGQGRVKHLDEQALSQFLGGHIPDDAIGQDREPFEQGTGAEQGKRVEDIGYRYKVQFFKTDPQLGSIKNASIGSY